MSGKAEHKTQFSVAEEIAHSLTHGIGAFLSIAGLAAMVSVASVSGSASHMISAAVFGTTLVVMYSVSALYHGMPVRRFKKVLYALDLCAIYLLIAGTYTPFALVSVRGAWGASMLVTIWVLAAIGIVIVVRAGGRYLRVSIAMYVAMGWLGLVALEPLIRSVPPGGLLLLILGGVAYTVGIAFFAWRRLPFNHAIWHVFVMTGSALHFLAVLLYVLPAAA
ncbi:MAG: hemolysin III family protein [Acidobacteriota bacterium]|nr:hemolysin III family protein [Acidobacteriota bacterium]